MKKFKLNKQLFLGVILGVTVSTSLPLFANTVKYVLNKVEYKFVINGESYQTKNDVLSYNGTTYLPLRELSEALGLNLSFNNGVITVESGNVGNVDVKVKDDVVAPVVDVIVEKPSVSETPSKIKGALLVTGKESQYGINVSGNIVSFTMNGYEYKGDMSSMPTGRVDYFSFQTDDKAMRATVEVGIVNGNLYIDGLLLRDIK